MADPIPGADRVIVALDRPTTDENLALIDALDGHARWFKVGMRQFYAGGEPVLERIEQAGAQLFLDLKLHDIPKTVEGAARSLARFSPALTTVHASGGAAMIRAAVEAFGSLGATTRVLAVTVLTSLDADDLAALGVAGTARDVARRWAAAAVDAGAHGLVCSGHEAAALRAAVPGALLVTPGIRLAGDAVGDQKRVMTPRRALEAGATHLVVGRPIHAADDPAAAFARVCADAASAHSG